MRIGVNTFFILVWFMFRGYQDSPLDLFYFKHDELTEFVAPFLSRILGVRKYFWTHIWHFKLKLWGVNFRLNVSLTVKDWERVHDWHHMYSFFKRNQILSRLRLCFKKLQQQPKWTFALSHYTTGVSHTHKHTHTRWPFPSQRVLCLLFGLVSLWPFHLFLFAPISPSGFTMNSAFFFRAKWD